MLIAFRRIEDGRLSGDPKMRARWMPLKDIMSPDLDVEIETVLLALAPLDPLEDGGRADSKAEGKADTLLRLLGRRFCAVPDAAREWIARADVAALDRWLDRVIDATDLAAVLKHRSRN